LLNDNISYNKRFNDLKKYNYKIYAINNEDEKLNISEQIKLSKIKAIQIENENIYLYLFIMNSKLQEISDYDLLFDNIYPDNKNENELIPPNHISKIYFYYFRINSELQKKYFYIESEKRKELYTILSDFLTYAGKNVNIIVGPKGVGKTSTLIRFSFTKELRIFYFNLESFQINSEEIKKKN
jgi:flagellar biosynthesis GTPase FlhF